MLGFIIIALIVFALVQKHRCRHRSMDWNSAEGRPDPARHDYGFESGMARRFERKAEQFERKLRHKFERQTRKYDRFRRSRKRYSATAIQDRR
jgi:hypothetical protein